MILNRTWRGSYLVDCYMKQFCVSKEQAVQVIANIVSTAWKDLNRELMRPHSFCFPFLIRILNLSRVIDVFYRYTDAYTNPKFLKEHIVSLIIENIPNWECSLGGDYTNLWKWYWSITQTVRTKIQTVNFRLV